MDPLDGRGVGQMDRGDGFTGRQLTAEVDPVLPFVGIGMFPSSYPPSPRDLELICSSTPRRGRPHTISVDPCLAYTLRRLILRICGGGEHGPWLVDETLCPGEGTLDLVSLSGVDSPGRRSTSLLLGAATGAIKRLREAVLLPRRRLGSRTHRHPRTLTVDNNPAYPRRGSGYEERLRTLAPFSSPAMPRI